MLLPYFKKNPDESLNYCERRVNNGSRSNFTEQFLPRIGNPFTCEKFRLSALAGTAENFRIYGELPMFCREFFGDGRIYVHPELANYYPTLDIQPIDQEAVPTSSSRTVKLLPYPYYVKLCYPDRIGRVTRELDERHIYSSLDITERFERIASHHDASGKFAFMPERGGILFSTRDGPKIGAVLREQRPVGKDVSSICCMIPGFSLFSADRDSLSDELLLLQLVNEKCGSVDKLEYILAEFCYPLIDVFFNCVTIEGIVPEMHSQNILFGFDDAWNLKAIIIRDLESSDKDVTLMRRLGKTDTIRSYPFKCIDENQYNYAIKHSFMFDHKLGEYFIAELLEVVANGNESVFSGLCSEIKDYVARRYGHFIKDIGFFPPNGKWYKFKNVIVDRTLPERPYDILDNPLFR